MKKKFASDDDDSSDLKGLIKIKLLQFAADAAQEDADFGSFCSHISKRHCIVNYQTQSQDDIITMIQKKLDIVKPIPSKGMIFSRISNQNILSEKGGSYIQMYEAKSLEYVKAIDNIVNDAKNAHTKQKKSNNRNQ